MTLMDTAQLLGNFGEFVGATVVFVTLIYLVRQVRQNTRSLTASAYQTWVATNMSMNDVDSDLSVTLASGVYDSSGLNNDNYMQFAMWNYSFIQMAQATDYLHEMGSIDDDLWKAEMSRTHANLGQPGVQQWWQAGGRTQFPAGFVARLEAVESDAIRWAWEENRGFVAEGQRGS